VLASSSREPIQPGTKLLICRRTN